MRMPWSVRPRLPTSPHSRRWTRSAIRAAFSIPWQRPMRCSGPKGARICNSLCISPLASWCIRRMRYWARVLRSRVWVWISEDSARPCAGPLLRSSRFRAPWQPSSLPTSCPILPRGFPRCVKVHAVFRLPGWVCPIRFMRMLCKWRSDWMAALAPGAPQPAPGAAS